MATDGPVWVRALAVLVLRLEAGSYGPTRWCFSFHYPSRTILLGSWVVDIRSRVSWNVPDLSYYTLSMVKDKPLSVNLIGSQYKWCHSRILLPLGSFHLFPGHTACPLVVSRRRGSHLFNHLFTSSLDLAPSDFKMKIRDLDTSSIWSVFRI